MSRSPAYHGFRSRHELLATQVVSSDEFLHSIEAYGPNGLVHPRESLSPIAVVLQPDESVDGYEWSFRQWLERQEVTPAMLESDPEEERRLRQCFVCSRVQDSASKEWSSTSPRCKRRWVTVDDEPSSRDESEQYEAPWSKYAGDLARQLTEMEGRINAQFVEMKLELRGLRCREERRAEERGKSEGAKETGTSTSLLPTLSIVPVKREKANQPAHNASIYKTATELMSRAMQLDWDGTQKRLVEVYTRFNEKIMKMKASHRNFVDGGLVATVK
ncbi:uncharacterized protein IUM83_03180 [Phytophthora cinnamomi]|uniref:uncharacterized protein n=1 Tax=Phytophthora cinnamomi TaxID=4785 RepID=UPI00355AA489|nr:hypothetical protein IUM83_03180 [Phytophthora cinnamomi]